jgi:lipid-binding SYLF domain-containing protein
MVDVFKKAGLDKFFDEAYGWAVFPEVVKGGIGIGGGYGSGKVYAKTDGPSEPAKHVGNSTLTQLSFGVQLGGQVFSEIVFFENEEAFQKFTKGNFEFAANANVVALTYSADGKISTAGSSGTATTNAEEGSAVKDLGYFQGMATFTLTKKGLMYAFTINGQKFSYEKAAC